MTEHGALTCDEFLDLAAAVALDASDAEEVRRVEEHAARCPGCRARLDEFRETAAALGMFAPQIEPPSLLRTRLMKSVRSEPRSLRRSVPRLLRRLPTPAWGVAAASLLVSIGALTRVIMMQGQINDLRQSGMLASERAARYDHVVEVLASDKLAIRPLQPVSQNASTGVVYMDPSSGMGMVMCHNLPAIQQGHAYQIWFVRGQERVSGGLLWPDHYGNGYTLIQVPSDLQSFDSIGLTDEPGTGSAWPTTPRVIGSRLKEADN